MRSLFDIVAGQPEIDRGYYKIIDVTDHLGRNRFGLFADNICNIIYGMKTVELFPD